MQNNPTKWDRLKLSFTTLTKSGFDKRQTFLRKQMGLQILNESYGYSDIFNFHPQDIYRPREKLSYRRRNRLFIDCAILRVVIDKVNKEMHRNGFELKKDFVRKCRREYIEPCKNIVHMTRRELGESPIDDDCGMCPTPNVPLGQDECGEEYNTEQIRCTDCKMPTRTPELYQKRVLRKYLKKPLNKQDQMLGQVVRQVNIDVEKHDNGYFINEFTYIWDEKVKKNPIKPTNKIWRQTYRGNPAKIRPVIRHEGDLGSDYYTCILHRQTYELHPMANEYTGVEYNKVPRCKANTSKIRHKQIDCGQILQKVYYVNIREEGSENDVLYSYIKDEIIHIKKYYPAGALGVSLIDSLYYSILQIIGQEKWIAEYYLKMRMFKGFFTVPNEMGGQQDSVQKMVFAEFSKWRQDPYYTPIIGIPSEGKDMVYHRIDDSPKELQFIENRQEARTQVANAYGIANAWMNDTSTGAGLNNQGVDIAITNRSIEFGQRIMEEQGLRKLCASWLNIRVEEVEWYIGYRPHEEQDLMAERQRLSLDIANARAAQEIGANVYIDAEGNFNFAAPIEGKPLISLEQGKDNKQPYQDVEGVNEGGMAYERRSQSKPFSGATNEPKVSGSGITVKSGNGINKSTPIIIDKATTADVFDIMQINKKTQLNELHYSELVYVIDNHLCFVAKDEGKIVGYSINMHDSTNNMLRLMSIAVDENYKRLGIAKRMINEGIYAAKSMQYSGIKLEVRESNSSAIKLYNETGFRTREISQNYYTDGESAMVMEFVIEKTKDKVSFKYEYRYDWEFEDDHNWKFLEFKMIDIEDIIIPDEYGVTDKDPKRSTVTYFMENPQGIPALVVELKDEKYYLKDGYHRLFVLRTLQVPKVLVACVEEVDYVITKDGDPEFEDKHPREGGGRFASKPKFESGDIEEPDAETDSGGETSDELFPPEVKPSAGGQGAVSTSQQLNGVGEGGGAKPKGDLLEHLLTYGGFILDSNLQYFIGNGFWVGIPFEPNFTFSAEISESIISMMVKETEKTIAQLPPMNFVICGWIQDDKIHVGIGEIHENVESAIVSATDNKEREVWDFFNDHSIIVKLETNHKGNIYDFFAQRGKYWENKPYMSIMDYIQIKGDY